MAGCKWVFTDPISSASYTFDVNPNAASRPSLKKQMTVTPVTAPNGNQIIFEGRDEVPEIEFSGTILTEAMYTTMLTWFDKHYKIYLTDDQDYEWIVYWTEFSPRRVRTSAAHPQKRTYDARALVFGVVP